MNWLYVTALFAAIGLLSTITGLGEFIQKRLSKSYRNNPLFWPVWVLTLVVCILIALIIGTQFP